MSKKERREICWECGKERERCRVASEKPDGRKEWICPQCWRDLNMEAYLYEHRTEGSDHAKA